MTLTSVAYSLRVGEKELFLSIPYDENDFFRVFCLVSHDLEKRKHLLSVAAASRRVVVLSFFYTAKKVRNILRYIFFHSHLSLSNYTAEQGEKCVEGTSKQKKLSEKL